MPSYSSIVLATALSLTACAGPASDGDAVLVVAYTPDFQAVAAAEYEALPPSCQTNDAHTPPGCSALKAMINDYLHLRRRLRAE